MEVYDDAVEKRYEWRKLWVDARVKKIWKKGVGVVIMEHGEEWGVYDDIKGNSGDA